MSRFRRMALGLAIGATGFVVFGPATAAHAAGATFVVGSGYISYPYQEVTPGGSVRIYNGDGATHHIVSYDADSPWGLDAVLAPGQSVTVAFGTWGTYDFRDANQSSLDAWGDCSGSCASVSAY